MSDADRQEMARLRQEVESLNSQLAAAHAAAVVPETTTAVMPPAAPTNVLADTAPTNGGAKPVRKPGRKPGPELARS
jgi:hypothetical protein